MENGIVFDDIDIELRKQKNYHFSAGAGIRTDGQNVRVIGESILKLMRWPMMTLNFGIEFLAPDLAVNNQGLFFILFTRCFVNI